MRGSYKTTTAALSALAIAAVSAIKAVLDGDPTTNPDWPLIFTAAASAIGLMFARDDDKSSEDVGAK